jgi:hypothetical protein
MLTLLLHQVLSSILHLAVSALLLSRFDPLRKDHFQLNVRLVAQSLCYYCQCRSIL